MDAIVIEIEGERRGLAWLGSDDAAASAGLVKRCSSPRCSAVGLFDVAEDATGADRGELLIITNQPDTPTTSDHRWTAVSRVRVSAMLGFIDDQQC